MDKLLVFVLVFAGILVLPSAYVYAVEFYDPLLDLPGKFMGPHGFHDWHYHGPPANRDAHCHAALEDPNAPEGVHHFCEAPH